MLKNGPCLDSRSLQMHGVQAGTNGTERVLFPGVADMEGMFRRHAEVLESATENQGIRLRRTRCGSDQNRVDGHKQV